jgi:hypothetical protein
MYEKKKLESMKTGDLNYKEIEMPFEMKLGRLSLKTERSSGMN